MASQSQQSMAGAAAGPRRFHIAHRRSPSEMTPMIMEQLALQQQIEQLQQQQQQIAGIHQQYVNMGMLPAQQDVSRAAPVGLQPASSQLDVLGAQTGLNPYLPAQTMQPQPFQQQPIATSMSMPVVHGAHRRNHSALPGFSSGPPPAPSSGSAFGDFLPQQIIGLSPRDVNMAQQSKTANAPYNAGHNRRHSLALPQAKKAAELAQQKRNASNFQFPANTEPAKTEETARPTMAAAGRGGSFHGRSQSMAVSGSRSIGNLRAANFQFPPPEDLPPAARTGTTDRRGSHSRTPSRNFEGNWRQPNPNVGEPAAAEPFQPSHKNRNSITQSLSMLPGAFQPPGQFVQLPNGQVVQGQVPKAVQSAQFNANQQQRKTLFTPYLPHTSLPALLSNDQLVAGVLRVNKKNRSDAYVTSEDLDADIFICGSKDRNRALEGDMVAIELLDVDEVWAQKRDKEEKKKRKDLSDARMINDTQRSDPEGGMRRRGSLRQRPTQKKNDDFEVEGQSLLLMDEEEISDEQKPLYAGHVVAIIERVPSQMFSGTLGLLRPSSQATKDKQEAERQSRDGSRPAPSERQQEKPKIVWFKPTDKRVPLIAIPTEQAPKDFIENHQNYANQIFVASIKRWPITSLHPFGILVDHLGSMGDLRAETDALLRDNNFGPDEFSDAVVKSIGFEDWSITEEQQSQRRDYRDEMLYTIDISHSEDLSNAVHVKVLAGDVLEFGFHTVDVAHFLKPGSLVDREARKRGSSVALINRSVPMLPERATAELCSLKPQQDRLAVSVTMQYDTQRQEILEDQTWIGKTIVRSVGTVTAVDLDGSDFSQLKEFCNFLKHQRYSCQRAVPPLRLMHQLDDENIPVEHNIFASNTARELLDELHYKVNGIIAKRLVEQFPDQALLRTQGEPSNGRFQAFADRMRILGHHVSLDDSRGLWQSLLGIEDDGIRKAAETLLFKTMRRAKYGVANSKGFSRQHFALNMPVYTHFTSPTRRYADIVVHRQLEMALSDDISNAETSESMGKIVETCNSKVDGAQMAQEQSIHIDSCRLMDKKRDETKKDLVTEGIVLSVYESAFDVLILEYGFEKRVHCDQLPLKKAEFRTAERVLELYWDRGIPSPAYLPDDERQRTISSSGRGNADRAARLQEARENGSAPTETCSQAGLGQLAQTLQPRFEEIFAKLSLREGDSGRIQEVRELTRVPIHLITDLSKSPPCLTVRAVNPFA